MNNKGFTLAEILISIILIGIIATFGIPLYSKALKKGQERTAISQLSSIHAMATIYKDETGAYPDTFGTDQGKAYIDATLNVLVLDKGMTITYNGPSTGTSFSATAVLISGQSLEVTEAPLTSSNPCCSAAGTCLIVPDC